MFEDDILREVRAAREAYARSHDYDIRAMVEDLRARDAAGDWPTARRPPRRPNLVAAPTSAANQPLMPTRPT